MTGAAPVALSSSTTRALRYAGAVVLFGLLFWIIDPRELAASIIRADPWRIVVVAVLSVVWLFLGALNIWILLRSRARVSLPAFTHVYLLSWSIGQIIPGQLGDSSQILLLRRYGIAMAASAAAYSIDKVISLIFLSTIATYGAMRFGLGAGTGLATSIALGGAVALVIGTMTLYRFFPVRRLPTRVGDFLAVTAAELSCLLEYPGLVAANCAVSVVKWILIGTLFYLAFSALGVSISAEAAATIPIVSSLVAYVPITISGIGTTEWTAVSLFYREGIEPVDVVATYIIMRGVLLGCAALILLVGRLGRRAHPD